MYKSKDDNNVMLKIKGKPYRCSCGANVLTFLAKEQHLDLYRECKCTESEELYMCNSCKNIIAVSE